MSSLLLPATVVVFGISACGGGHGGAGSPFDAPDAIGPDASGPRPSGDVTGTPAVTPDVVAEADPSSPACQPGTSLAPDGGCMPVGPGLCAAELRDPDDGLCRPSLDLCPPGAIPRVDVGCVPVGIPDCAEVFIDPETGLCRPARSACASGTIPHFTTGCVPVGVPTCAGTFTRTADGACAPSSSDCPDGHVLVPSEGCVPVDGEAGCGAPPWGELVELPGDVHVDPTWNGGPSDGTRAKPWPLIGQAIGQVQPGGRVVLGAGTYDGGLVVAKDVVFEGACPSLVTISGALDSVAGPTAVRVQATSSATLRGVRITGSSLGVVVSGGAVVTLDRVFIDRTHGVGLIAVHEGTDVTLHRSLVRGTQPFGDGTFGRGVQVQAAARAALTSSSILSSAGAAAVVSEAGSTLVVVDSFLADGDPKATGARGVGVEAQYGGRAEVTSSVLSDNREIALFAIHAGSELLVTDTVVARTQPNAATGFYGRGLTLQDGAEGAVVGTVVTDCRDIGVAGQGAGTSLEATGNLIAHTLPELATGDWGQGLVVDDGAVGVVADNTIVDNYTAALAVGDDAVVSATGNLLAEARDGLSISASAAAGVQVLNRGTADLAGNAIVGSEGAGVVALHAGTTVTSAGDLIAYQLPGLKSGLGHGLFADEGASVVLARTALVGNHGSGLWIGGPGAVGHMIESLVAWTTGGAGGQSSRGVTLEPGSKLTLEASAVVGNEGVGVLAWGAGAELVVDRSLVALTTPLAGAGTFGRGINAQHGVQVTVLDSVLLGNHDIGAFASNDGTTLAAERLLIADTAPNVADGSDGVGLHVQDGAAGTCTACLLAGNHDVGAIAVDPGSALTLAASTVSGTAPAANGEGGCGAWVQWGASLVASGSTFSDNAMAAVLAYEGTLSLEDTLLQGTTTSTWGELLDLADGVAATGAQVSLTSIVSTGNARGGLVLDDCTGLITDSVFTANAYGVVVQGADQPDFAADNEVAGNGVDWLDNGSLPVADAPVDVPSPL